MEAETRTLTKMKIGYLTSISKELLLDPDVQFIDGCLGETIQMAVKGFLWAEHVGEVKIDRPANWWEHLKKALRIPYRKLYTTVSFNAYYPDYRMIPNLGQASLRLDYAPDWNIDEPLLGSRLT